ncbi:MAG: heavy metal translocating P-type ATPase [Tissierellia bacterium]|nr:heavy metal translocating P-type ATPase [Tissierellia bacterium]
MKRKQKKILARIIITIIIIILLNILNLSPILNLIGYILAYLIIGYDIIRKAILGIVHGRLLDENFLMVIATIGAFFLAIYEKEDDYLESVAVMLFFQIGELFESMAINKSRKNILSLMDIRPDYANIEKDGKIIKIDPKDVSINSTIIVNPGEKVPIDGIVLEGESSLDTKALTGESMPKDIKKGDQILSGCINLNGILKVKTTKNFGESTVTKILELVENSTNKKAKSENFISKFAKVYTPIVCTLALILSLFPPILNIILSNPSNWHTWIYRALIFLVISCPCALVVSVPLSFFAGIGGASREGILIKGSNFMEVLSKINYLVFDKTGTITKGEFETGKIFSNNMDQNRLLEYAALAESASNHPISKSLIKKYNKKLDLTRIEDIKEYAGYGISAKIDQKEVLVGNEKLMKKFNVNYKKINTAFTIIYVAIDKEYEGYILVKDAIKKNSKKAMNELKQSGIKKLIMLTGDKKEIASIVTNDVGIDEFYAELLPQQKVEKVEEFIKNKPKSSSLAFIGDGINDAPALALSDVGISMGLKGSDAAIEASDVVLMDDDPLKISKAIKIAKKTLKIVYENIIFAIGIKVICLILATFGLANMWLAIFADVGVTMIAVLNAIRCLKVKDL